jgi:hypothetical protein
MVVWAPSHGDCLCLPCKWLTTPGRGRRRRGAPLPVCANCAPRILPPAVGVPGPAATPPPPPLSLPRTTLPRPLSPGDQLTCRPPARPKTSTAAPAHSSLPTPASSPSALKLPPLPRMSLRTSPLSRLSFALVLYCAGFCLVSLAGAVSSGNLRRYDCEWSVHCVASSATSCLSLKKRASSLRARYTHRKPHQIRLPRLQSGKKHGVYEWRRGMRAGRGALAPCRLCSVTRYVIRTTVTYVLRSSTLTLLPLSPSPLSLKLNYLLPLKLMQSKLRSRFVRWINERPLGPRR